MDLAEIYDIETYIDTINRDYHTGVATEQSFRGPLQNLLRALLNEELIDYAKFITDESNAASSIKRDTPLVVVMGNQLTASGLRTRASES